MNPRGFDHHVTRASEVIRSFFKLQEAGEVTEAEDPRPALADELFGLWDANREGEGATKVLSAAFRIWGSLGSVDELERALLELGSEAACWSRAIDALAAAYFRADRLGELPESLRRLEPTLTRREALVTLYFNLGRYHLWFAGEPEKARSCYERLGDLDPGPIEELWVEGALHEIERLQPGQAAPPFAATALDGREIRLEESRGRVVLLAFWSADCGPCRPEMPVLRSIRGEHGECDLVLIGVSKDGDRERCRSAVHEEGLHGPQIWEPYPRLDHPLRRAQDYPDRTSIARQYNVWVIPRTFLIGRDGTIVANFLRRVSVVEAVRNAVRR